MFSTYILEPNDRLENLRSICVIDQGLTLF